mmetsp:Transcript_124189/g.322572  ORF Transcript_124189/g.322572 Transcript_124189/m.322572 type:complete len:282 (+) Transcript_124189:498-1343(+)
MLEEPLEDTAGVLVASHLPDTEHAHLRELVHDELTRAGLHRRDVLLQHVVSVRAPRHLPHVAAEALGQERRAGGVALGVLQGPLHSAAPLAVARARQDVVVAPVLVAAAASATDAPGLALAPARAAAVAPRGAGRPAGDRGGRSGAKGGALARHRLEQRWWRNAEARNLPGSGQSCRRCGGGGGRRSSASRRDRHGEAGANHGVRHEKLRVDLKRRCRRHRRGGRCRLQRRGRQAAGHGEALMHVGERGRHSRGRRINWSCTKIGRSWLKEKEENKCWKCR